MAAAYGAAAGVSFWVMFKAGMWMFDTGVGAWGRWKDNRQSKENKP